VLVGGRGKAGGVRLARSADDAAAVATAILGMYIKGSTVRRVLVAPAAEIVRELYIAAVLDRAARRILLMGSAQGGVDIETLAEEDPAAIVQLHASGSGYGHTARAMAFALDWRSRAVRHHEGSARSSGRTPPRGGQPLAVVRETGPDGRGPGAAGRQVTLDDSAHARH
jgi:succinyl-CoA synthetase beta subunit